MKRKTQLRSHPERGRGASEKTAAKLRAPGTRRKIVELDEETWHGLGLLGRDTFATFQDLADEAFRDLLVKHHRPVTLRDALRQSAKAAVEQRTRKGDVDR
jgi:hypothetical protein